jgi:RNA polymerase sigma-70 factor (ECF subfamily)
MLFEMSEDKWAEKDDHELIQRMASKDANALDAFYSRYNRLAFSLIFRILGNRADAEDVLSEVFWQVWQQSSRYDSSRGKPVAWLLTISRTRAIDRLRYTNRQQMEAQVEEAQLDPPSSAAEPDPFVRAAVQEALQSLGEQQRIPLEMAYFQGMSHTEIAAALGQPLGTVKDRIRTGMLNLKKRLRPYL